jgi:nucleoside 2-deoxyribosyltransferase
VFDDWFAAGPEADDRWQAYEQNRGRPYDAALKGEAAQNVFRFDQRHISDSDTGVLYLPAGKSGHMELGVMIGMGKPGFIVMDKEPERWDVMYNFATGVFFSWEDLAARMGEME